VYQARAIDTRAEQRDEDVCCRQRAYAVWLVTNPAFRRERDALREDMAAHVRTRGCFPRLGCCPPFDDPWPLPPEELPFLLFFRRWSLASLVTWDLPEPMRPDLLGRPALDRVTASGAGVSLFVPWYLLRDGALDLPQLARDLNALHGTTHLDGWFRPAPGEADPLGYSRLGHQYFLYRYGRLALGTRYPERLRGNIGRLDDAFGDYLGVSTESVRKVRQDLDRNLS
jgi:hypothetical protein